MSLFSIFWLVLSGFCWSIVYIDGIRSGYKDQTYAIPWWALALNFAWEVLHSILGWQEFGWNVQVVINVFWAILDCGLLWTYFRYGRRYFPNSLNPNWFWVWNVAVILFSFGIQAAFIFEFGLVLASVYAAFGQNLLMSVLFIAMILQRNNTAGQTLRIAILKCLGTLAPTLLMGICGIDDILPPKKFVLILGSIIFVFDLVYIKLVYELKRRE